MRFWPFSREVKASSSDDDVRAQLAGESIGKGSAGVNTTTALQVTTVLACVRVIAEGLAQVPLKLFQESQDGRIRETAKDHPLYRLLHRKPNRWMSSFELRETMAIHAALTGKAVAFVNRMPGSGKILEIIPFKPNDVEIIQNDDLSITYRVRGKDGSTRDLPQESIWHLRGPSWDGVVGLDVMKLSREAIGLSMTLEEDHASMHRNGVKTTGIYSVEGQLNEAQHKMLSKWIAENYGGSGRTGTPLILDRAAKFHPQTMSGVDSQHLETRKHQIEEICRAFRVMPIMVAHADKTATYASAEQMFLAHIVHTLAPWYERIEQSIDCQLLTDKEQAEGYYAKHVTAGLLRGALKDTAAYLVALSNNGIMTRNEARGVLEFNPIDGLDEPLMSANTTTGDPEEKE